jgi:hypothetical protein
MAMRRAQGPGRGRNLRAELDRAGVWQVRGVRWIGERRRGGEGEKRRGEEETRSGGEEERR